MGWIAQPLGTWTVFSAEGELCAGESVAAWEVGIPGMQRFNGRCSKGATVVCTNVERERRADYGQPLPSRPRNAPANTTRTPTLGPCRKASSAFRKGFRPIPVHVVLDHTSKTLHTFTAVGLQLLLSAQHAAHHSYCISPQAEMRTPAAPFVPEPVLFQSALPSLHVAWRRNRCQAQANHSFTVDRPLSTRACVSLLLVLSIFQISILACVISCV